MIISYPTFIHTATMEIVIQAVRGSLSHCTAGTPNFDRTKLRIPKSLLKIQRQIMEIAVLIVIAGIK